jgi:hypothetical protein
VSVALLAVVAMVIAAATAMFWPLRTAHTASTLDPVGADALELARDAKLGELHDLELDFRLGKLSPEDYRTLNETLRSEAVEAIRLLDATTTNGRRRR